MIFHKARLFLAGLVGLLALTGPSSAADPEAKLQPTDPAARALLDDMVRAYKTLPAYADEGKFLISLKVDGRPQVDSWPMALKFVRPDKVNLDAGDVRLVGDGKTITTTIVPSRKYMVGPAGKTLSPIAFTEGPLGAMLLGGPSGPSASHLLNSYALLNLLTGDDPAQAILEPSEALTLEPDRPHEGKVYKVLRIDQASGPNFRLLIDPETKLLGRIELVIDPQELKEKAPPGVTLSDASIGWSSGPVTTTAPKDETFAFHAPAGFTKVAAIEMPEREDSAVQEMLGQAAPEFTLSVLDGKDKTKLLSKADLAGEVVVLDFWATWCGPCLMELPEIEKLVESFAQDDKKVVVVALSQDNDPEDPAEVRKLVETTLSDEKVNLNRDVVGKVAIDPTNAVGEAFRVHAFPTIVILDEKGVIQAYHRGYRPDIGAILAHDVETLLQGKTLVEPKKPDAEVKPAAGIPAR